MQLPQIFSRLLVRPQPMAGESQWGFWLRLADENGLQRPQWLQSQGERLPAGLTRHCPTCLGSSHAMWSQEWSSSDALWCRQHLTWLVDACRSCGRRLRWSNVRFQECDCGLDFRQAEVVAADSALVAAVASESVSPEILRLLGAFALYGPSGKPGKKACRSAIEDAKKQLNAGFGLVSQWPEAFFSTLDQQRAAVDGPGTAQLLREALPGLVELLALIMDEAWRAKVSTAVDAYCARSLASENPIIGRNAVLREGPSTLKEISERLRRRPERIAAVIDEAETQLAAVRVTARGRRRRVVAEDRLIRLTTALGDRVAVKTAARQVALPPSRLRALVTAGGLTLQRGCLLQSELAELVKSLSLAPLDSSGVNAPMLPLRKAFRDWVHVRDTAALFLALHAGELLVLQPSPTSPIGAWLVSASDIEAWMARRRNEPGDVLSLSQAAHELELKHDVALDLVRKGILPAKKGAMAHRNSWLVSRNDLVSFNARYVPLVQLSRGAGVSARDGFAWAQSQGLSVVCGPKVDGSRQYFVERVKGARAN